MDAFDRLVIVNRHNAPAPLELCIPLELAIDKPWCAQTSRAIAGSGKWEIFEATESLGDHLPPKAGLYMFVWKIPFCFPTFTRGDHFFRVVVYVGQAGANQAGSTLQKRYRQEYADIVSREPQSLWNSDLNGREARVSRALNLRDLEFWCLEIGQVDLLGAFEETLIKLFNPPANSHFTQRQGSKLHGRLGRAIPAF